MSGAERLAALVHAEGGLLADALAPAPPPADPLLAGAAGEDALVLAAVREGYRLHYDAGKVIRTADPDLALLGGDRLYALALARLAERGDLDAVAHLAELIATCAQAHAEGEPGRAESAWIATTAAIVRRSDGR